MLQHTNGASSVTTWPMTLSSNSDLGGVFLTVYPELCALERAVTSLALAAGTAASFEFDDPRDYRDADHRAEALEDAADELCDALTRLDALLCQGPLTQLLDSAQPAWLERLLEACRACDHWLNGNERCVAGAHEDLCDVDAAVAAWRQALSQAALGSWASHFLEYWWRCDQRGSAEKLRQAFRDSHFGGPPPLTADSIRALVRAGATLQAVGGLDQALATTPLQRQILRALDGRVLKKMELASRLRCDSRLLFRPGGIRELLAREMVLSDRKVGGYFRRLPTPVSEPLRRLRHNHEKSSGRTTTDVSAWAADSAELRPEAPVTYITVPSDQPPELQDAGSTRTFRARVPARVAEFDRRL